MDDMTLNTKVLIAERVRHETTETANAVRQLGRQWTILPTDDKEPTLYDALKSRIRNLASTQKANTSTLGVGWRVRHTGSFVAEDGQSTRQHNKVVAQDVAASVSHSLSKPHKSPTFIQQDFLRHRTTSFLPLQFIHTNLNYGNILDYNPLHAGDFVIVLKPLTQAEVKKTVPELLLGQGIILFACLY